MKEIKSSNYIKKEAVVGGSRKNIKIENKKIEKVISSNSGKRCSGCSRNSK